MHKLKTIKHLGEHIDWPLLIGLLALLSLGLLFLFSASAHNMVIFKKQLVHIALALTLVVICACIPPPFYYQWAPWLFGLGLVMLAMVLGLGVIGKGAQRWLNLGFVRFEPSELMKIATPAILAWFLHNKSSPFTGKHFLYSSLLILVPIVLIIKEPDLGTALMIAFTSGAVLLLAGLPARMIAATVGSVIVSLPLAWHFMHHYQRERVLTFLNPERDPLSSGYHIIQSKIAIGSGGLFGKGWLHGTQIHLKFLPEHTTDFIFAVCGEEFGFLGSIVLLSLILFITGRGLYISSQAQTTFTRLLSGGLCLMFFISAFVNIGMVIGILPVVGLPLPFVSYGGTTLLTMAISTGILMSIHTHRPLLDS